MLRRVAEKKETPVNSHILLPDGAPAPRRTRHLAALATALSVGLAAPADARVYDAVEVRGAQFIPEADIRLTCGAEAGVDYPEADLRAIETCLMSTGVFDSVSVIGEGHRLVIEVEELETRPGRIDAALGYASQDGVLASLSFERYNLFDRTYGAFSLDYSPAVKRATANLYRTDALAGGLDLGVETVAGQLAYDDLGYVHEAVRTETYLAFPMTPETRLEGGIGFRDHRMTEVASDASAVLQAEASDGIAAPYLRFSISHEQAAGSAWAEPGYALSLDQYFWNIGSPDPLSDTRMTARLHLPLPGSLRLLTGLDASAVTGMAGNATRAIDRYFPGADTFRGFAPRGIGPRDDGDALGGNNVVKATVELQRDLGEVFKVPVWGSVFVDTGASWGLDRTLNGTVDDDFHLRSAAGVTLNVDINGTPASIYAAVPLAREEGDVTQMIGLSLRARF